MDEQQTLSETPPPPAQVTAADAERRAKEGRDWAMWIHLSLLAGYVVPWAGLILPIILWQMKKEEFPEIDIHGKNVANWIISAHIYGAIAVPLICFFFVGLLIVIPLAIASIVFPIIGGIKAGKGEVWSYPLSIPLFR
ncbi:MAG TPA: DUF4870 domain-containing protein [Planctomycetota bacterium]|nr:DUF4870 domain-containing protein [Planctomycetota bacterium]